jgi:hypothetical protein
VTRYCFLSEGWCLKDAVLFLWGALSHEGKGLQFAMQSLNGPSRAEPLTILYFLIWDFPKPEGPCSHIYILQEQGRPVTLPGSGLGSGQCCCRFGSKCYSHLQCLFRVWRPK